MSSPVERFKYWAAVFLILRKDGRVLLLERKDTGHQDGNYGLIAGHMEGHETAQKAIVREAFEEAGITVRTEDLRVVHVLHNYSSDREYMDIFMEASIWEGEPVNSEPDKCSDLSWFDEKALPVNMIPYIRSVLGHIDGGGFYSNFGFEK